MGKHRVYEIAKELDTDSKKILEILAGRHIDVKNHMSSVDDATRDMITKTIKGQGSGRPQINKEHAQVVRHSAAPQARQNNYQPNQTQVKAASAPNAAPKTETQDQSRSIGGKQVEVKKSIDGQKPVIVIHRPNPNRTDRPRRDFTPRNQQQRDGERPRNGDGSNTSTGNAYNRPNRPQNNNYNRNNANNGNRGSFNNNGQERKNFPNRNNSNSSNYTQRTGQYSNSGTSQRSGQYNSNSGSGQRSGQYNNSGNGQRSGQYNSNSGSGQRSGQYSNNNNGQRNGQFSNNGQRSGQYGNNNQRSGNNPRYGNNTNNNNRNKKNANEKPAAAPLEPYIAKDANRRAAAKPQKHDKFDKFKKENVKGSYATRDSRPNRNTDHLGRKNKNNRDRNAVQQTRVAAPVAFPAQVAVGDTIVVNDFANLTKISANEIIKKLFMAGVMKTINQEIDFTTAFTIGDDFGIEVVPKAPEEDPTEVPEVEDDPEKRLPRPPVVTVMGHVDHGKTSLLDAIRKTNVTAREAGGITQHIGAYKVTCQGKPIVFLDTPGHEAFTAMRARGAQVTDIAVLVVAADDGVMPQTLEAINHAKDAQVPIIVAINKMDKEGANPDHVKQQLMEQQLVPEEWGGDVIMVPVSAHKKTGINDLLESILLVAEVEELKANPNLPAHGTIIEAQLDKGRGPVATVLIDRGTLHIGDTIVVGMAYGKVRAMVNDHGEKVKKATPSTPVEVLGLNDVPLAGDILDATDERTARSVAEKRIAKRKSEEVKSAKVSLDDIFSRIQEGELKELNIVVKADVQGTIQALKQSLENIKNDEVKVSVVHASVGAINESDIMLASASNALVIGFNVRPDANARKAADTEKVDIRTYRVIYDAINDVEAAIKGMLAPKFKEVIIGHVEIRQVISISKMLIAGCYVTDGKVTNSAQIRLVRDGIVVFEGAIETLRRFKDDVKEVQSGFECGITLENYRDIKEGDQLEAFVMQKVDAE